MRGGVFPASIEQDEALARVRAETPMEGLDLASVVTPSEMTVHGSGDGPRIAAIDTGIKLSIVRQLVARGAIVELHPCSVTAQELLARDPDLVFLANGPGDPAALDQIVQTVRARRRQAARVGDLPRPSAALPGRRPGDLQARRSATAARTTPSRT